MANPTSNFNWQMPTNTDLVKDLPADFEVFGQAVDTSLADLKGGTSGQILSKNSNTDMDFVWINNDQGDITAVNVTSPITGGGSAGAVTVGIQDGTTAQKGAVQLENSTSSTSTTTAAVPASVKSAYDLADAAIPKSLVDAEGDLIVGDAADTVQRLAIGTTGQVLTVDTAIDGKIKWAAAASASGPAFRAYRSSSDQTITNNSMTKVQFNAEQFDTDNCFDSTTNYRFTPNKSGYYQLNWGILLSGMTGSDASQQTVLKFNGADECYGGVGARDITYNFTLSVGSVIKYFNGSTDYAEVFTKSDQGGTVKVSQNLEYTSFSGVWIRS